MEAFGAAPPVQTCPTGFKQLLAALQAEHECEVGMLWSEVHRLRGALSRPTPDSGGLSKGAFSAVVPCAAPCIPFRLSALKSVPFSGRRSKPSVQEKPSRAAEAVDAWQSGALSRDPQGKDEEPISTAAVGDAWQSGAESRCACDPQGQKEEAEPSRQSSAAEFGDHELRSCGTNSKRTNGQQHDTPVEGGLWPVWVTTPADGGLSEAISCKGRHASSTEWQIRSSRPNRGASSVSFSASLLLKWPLHPTSRFVMIWDLCAPLALLYDFVMVPMQVFGFAVTMGQHVMEGVILFYWICDMLVSCTTAYYDKQGQLVVGFRSIFYKYLKTWFLPEFTITGFDLVTTVLSWALPTGSDTSQNVTIARLGRFLRVARVVRLLRLGRVAKMRERIYRIQVYFDSEAVAIGWGISLNIFTLLVLNHVTACLWFYIGSADQDHTWLKVPFHDDRTYADVGVWEAYFVSLHWSLTLFTPASMSVQPQNLTERIYAVICLILAMVVFASFVSTVTAGMTRLRHLTAENVEQGYKLRKFLRENHISADLVARLTRYVDIAMKSHVKRVPKSSVVRLGWLSDPLQVELMWELSAPTLKMHSFFWQYGTCHVAAMRKLCFSAIVSQPVSRRDTLFSSFEQATSMYFIKAGNLIFKRARGLNLPRRMKLHKGDWFVEHVLWMKWVHRGTMKAHIECDLMAVVSTKFQQVSAAHPDVLAMASVYAANFKEQAHSANCCDIPQGIIDRQGFSQQLSNDSTALIDDVNFTSDSDNGTPEAASLQDEDEQVVQSKRLLKDNV